MFETRFAPNALPVKQSLVQIFDVIVFCEDWYSNKIIELFPLITDTPVILLKKIQEDDNQPFMFIRKTKLQNAEGC